MSSLPPGARALARLLSRTALERQTGILNATRGKLKRLFCVESGTLVFATSNVVEEQFGEELVRAGILTGSLRAEMAAEAKSREVSFTHVLREREIAFGGELRAAMDRHIRTLLSSCLSWPDGKCRFEVGRPKLDDEVTANIPIARAVVEHSRSYPVSLDALRMRIGRPDSKVELATEHEGLLDGLQRNPAIRHIVETAGTAKPLGELISSFPEGAEPAMRALYALLLLGIVTSESESREARVREHQAPTREELLARAAKSDDADHYMILGVERTANQQRIRDAYYSLARRLHPDRFRSGGLMDLLPRAEAFFTKVTEAYNTLHDIENRATYDELLAGSAAEAAAPSESDKSFLARQNYLRGKALLERKRYSDAVKFLENAVQLDQTQAEYFLQYGKLLGRNPRMKDQAEQNLLKVTELEPTSTDAYLALGELYARGDRHDDAERMYREVLRWDPGNIEASRLLKELGVDPRTLA